ncbi:MAG: acyl-CoA ligase (AMP-forming), exosortase A system-associated [Gammaproteobacteria bacterium]|nr:acyl-CoA ligase (AMP-forming), exosortase A system-associated [Gammaproteobacteria bacterium]
MSDLLHELLEESAEHRANGPCLAFKGESRDYATIAADIETFASGLIALDLQPAERVAVYLPKCFEAVTALFGTAMAGGAFVPINPLLKPPQVAHILKDSGARVLVTSRDRAPLLAEAIHDCPDLHTLVATAEANELPASYGHVQVLPWSTATRTGSKPTHRRIDSDLAAILYTSGSTGRPKGVVLSHRNMVAGARSVAQYLKNTPEDRLLAVLPFSFDYGFSQLSTAFAVGASVVLMDYLLPRDVIRAVARERITGLAAVPPLWVQLAGLDWPHEAVEHLRYITNSGGAMPRSVLDALRNKLPNTTPYLMYGLTEAFRSTYLPPAEIDRRPDSMGKAIPNADILVVREDGTPCEPAEPGELVHRGALVSLGYWNDPERTAERFRPSPGTPQGIPGPEIAVWSGDTVRKDEDGFLYFIGRRDEMIKTSGYRVSPTEVEEVLYGSGMVDECAALGLPHPSLGQGILAVIKPARTPLDVDTLLATCKRDLPGFMVPLRVEVITALPRNPNGKVDRKGLTERYRSVFEPTTGPGNEARQQ